MVFQMCVHQLLMQFQNIYSDLDSIPPFIHTPVLFAFPFSFLSIFSFLFLFYPPILNCCQTSGQLFFIFIHHPTPPSQFPYSHPALLSSRSQTDCGFFGFSIIQTLFCSSDCKLAVVWIRLSLEPSEPIWIKLREPFLASHRSLFDV